MNRRHVLTAWCGSVVALAGCLRRDDGGYTFTLRIEPIEAGTALDDAGVELLDFDRRPLTNGQRRVLSAAIDDGAYTESGVTWEALPGRSPITLEFRTLLRRIADHVGESARIEPGSTFATPIRFRRREYTASVVIE